MASNSPTRSKFSNGLSGLSGGEIVAALVLAFVLVVALWLFGAWIVQLVWNNGVVHAFHTSAISYSTALWLYVGLALIQGTFSLNKKSD